MPDDKYEIARQNTEEAKRRILMSTLPADGREASSYNLRQLPKNIIMPVKPLQ